ncbi:glutamate racemase [Endozoicomonas sp. SCSIO W0465]|uniref:glutamate racemase n=1 Tax=Endozoicomonas sp. SCSIO W0465 TaxID=2918516 RepID=UPI0020759EE8|nr:glutamate racemase [Endozoicomonas sp. SCSIO W0465]USE36603.1 glutamate racemase [Endozoicomonas sp. SCSIO W0465]
MNKRAKPIVIFDSGVGGLSIYQEIKQVLPHAPVVYCSDIHGFPYGPKPEVEVIERTSLCLNAVAEQFDPSLAVIACNTASTISLPRVREELDFPVVGVVPAIKTASEYSEKRCIGLLATPGTIARRYTDQLIDDFAGDCHVIRVGSSELVQMAEQYLRGEPVSERDLRKILAPFLEGELVPDAVVLGCTHFPLLREALQQLSADIHWIDSGAAIARRVVSLLGPNAFPADSAPQDYFMHTGQAEQVSALVPALENMGFAIVRYLLVEPKGVTPHSHDET